jgi:hypothetical protein
MAQYVNLAALGQDASVGKTGQFSLLGIRMQRCQSGPVFTAGQPRQRNRDWRFVRLN